MDKRYAVIIISIITLVSISDVYEYMLCYTDGNTSDDVLDHFFSPEKAIETLNIIFNKVNGACFVLLHVNFLKNQNRRKILEYISLNPGSTITNISYSLNINLGTVYYHIKKLELKSKIVLVKKGKYVSIYQNVSQYTLIEKILYSYFKNDKYKRILQVIIENPGITNQMISEKLNIDKSTTHWYLQKFIKDNLITSIKTRKLKYYYINAIAGSILNNHNLFPRVIV